MITVLKDLPVNVVGFKAEGDVTKDDYDKVVFPEIKIQMSLYDKLNYVFWVDTPLKNFSAAAWISDAWLGLKEIAKWNRVSIISDDEGIRSFTDKASHLIPGEFRGFTTNEYETAVEWVSGT
ncbi:MAG TPA: STAS/SEC14 domain-containing protein [Puia sp.]|jgi:hypothetical protein